MALSSSTAPPLGLESNTWLFNAFQCFSGYLGAQVMLGKCDAVHSGVALALVAVLIVGLTIGSTMGRLA